MKLNIDSAEMDERNKNEIVKKFVDDYTVLDLETTGLSPEDDSIIEIAMLKVRGGEIVDYYTKLINCFWLSDKIIEITGITRSMLQNAPNMSEVIVDIYKFLNNDIILAHNAKFDLSFLREAYKEHLRLDGATVEVNNSYIDTLYITRNMFPHLSNHKLSTIAKAFGLKEPKHRAMSDCLVTYSCYEHIKKHGLGALSIAGQDAPNEYYEQLEKVYK